MFDIRKEIDGRPRVYIDGKLSAGSFVKEKARGRRSRKIPFYQLSFVLKEDFLSVARQPIKNLKRQHVEKIDFENVEKLGSYQFNVNVTLIPGPSLLSLTLGGAKSWNEDFSFTDLQDELLTSFRMDSSIKAYALGAKTIIQVELEEQRLFSEVFLNITSELDNRIGQFLRQARRRDSENAFSVTFDFPRGVSTACERYLMYFADFLTEIGIEATSDIKHEAGKVLFTVMPSNPNQALYGIKEALEIYLETAKYPIAVITDENDIVSLKWKNAVEALHAELSLTQRALQIRTREVRLLEQALEHQYDRAAKMANEEQNSLNQKGTNTEVIIPGILSVKEFEKGPIQVDIPNIVRRIKKYVFRTPSDDQ